MTTPEHRLHVRLNHPVAECAECNPEGDRRTFYEWNESGELDFKVLDPDGFPRHDLTAMQNTRYTREEFIDKARYSTVQPMRRRL
jgi:hypothetical protein